MNMKIIILVEFLMLMCFSVFGQSYTNFTVPGSPLIPLNGDTNRYFVLPINWTNYSTHTGGSIDTNGNLTTSSGFTNVTSITNFPPFRNTLSLQILTNYTVTGADLSGMNNSNYVYRIVTSSGNLFFTNTVPATGTVLYTVKNVSTNSLNLVVANGTFHVLFGNVYGYTNIITLAYPGEAITLFNLNATNIEIFDHYRTAQELTDIASTNAATLALNASLVATNLALEQRANYLQAQIGCETNDVVFSGFSGTPSINVTNTWSGSAYTNGIVIYTNTSAASNLWTVFVSGIPAFSTVYPAGNPFTTNSGTGPAGVAAFFTESLSAGLNAELTVMYGNTTISVASPTNASSTNIFFGSTANITWSVANNTNFFTLTGTVPSATTAANVAITATGDYTASGTSTLPLTGANRQPAWTNAVDAEAQKYAGGGGTNGFPQQVFNLTSSPLGSITTPTNAIGVNTNTYDLWFNRDGNSNDWVNIITN